MRSAAFPIVALISSGLCIAVEPSARVVHWQEDLEFMASGLRASGHTVDLQQGIATRGQKDFDKLYPISTFDPELKALKSEVASLADSEIVLRIMKIWASANIAHNSVEPPQNLGFDRRLPLAFHWYSDGLAVYAAAPEYAAAIGTRVIKIGAMTSDQVLSAAAPYVPHENEVWLKEEAPEYLRLEPLLRQIGAVGPDGGVAFTLQKSGEAPFILQVSFADLWTRRVPFTEALHVPTTIFRSEPGKYYWYRYLAESKTFYIQYNKCENQKGHPFSDFAREALAAMDANRAERVIVDLRWNGGGDSRVIDPLKRGLSARLKKIGPVLVFIGPETFSSGLDNAMELRDALHAKTAGEPAGGQPKGYGEVKKLKLPNSGVVIRYTTKFFNVPKRYEGDTLNPDIAAPRTMADDFTGRDPVLEAALK